MALSNFKSHKIISAGKINVIYGDLHFGIEQSDGSNLTMDIPAGLFARSKASPGDYFVVYADGYSSWSPAKAFEDGYTKVEE